MRSPIFIYDGACVFCVRWARRWRRWARGRVEFVEYQTGGAALPALPIAEFRREAKLYDCDGEVYGGAEAVFRMIHYTGGLSGVVAALILRFRLTLSVADCAYRWVAHHRSLLSRWTP